MTLVAEVKCEETDLTLENMNAMTQIGLTETDDQKGAKQKVDMIEVDYYDGK